MKKMSLAVGIAFMIFFLSLGARAQTCNSQTVDEAPASRYQANADGTALDKQTGLVWMRCALGQTWDAGSKQCSGTAATYTWQDALNAAQSLDQAGGFAGHMDWRLPNLRELESIERYHCSDPAINLTVFPNTPSEAFWSSSPLENDYTTAWVLDFGTSHAIYEFMSSEEAVRLVRAGAYDNQIPPPASSPSPASSANAAVIH